MGSPSRAGTSSSSRRALFIAGGLCIAFLIATLGTTSKWLNAVKRLNEVEDELQSVKGMLEVGKKRYKSAEQEARQVSKELKQTAGQLDLVKEERNHLEEDKRVVRAAMLRAQTDVHDLEEKSRATERQSRAFSGELDAANLKADDLRSQIMALNHSKAATETKLAEVLKRLSAEHQEVVKMAASPGGSGALAHLASARDLIDKLLKGKTQHGKVKFVAADPREERSRRILERQKDADVCTMEGSELEGRAVKQTTKRWVFKNEGKEGRVNYAHMAMVSKLPPAAPWAWIMVWQAAKELEGSDDQHFECAFSDDAVTWTEPMIMAIREHGCVWGPSLLRTQDAIWMFYSESTTCLRPARGDKPPRWSPGGHIKVMQSPDGLRWSKPMTIHEQWKNGGTPKVIANQPLVTDDAYFVLPFWQEVPRLDASVVGCTPDGEPAAGVLVSKDGGVTWKTSKRLHDVETWLIEGTVVAMTNGTLLQYFRTTTGYIWSSTSEDGHAWAPAAPAHLPNPNSKVNMIRLHNGYLALAYNHEGLSKGRSNLWVAISHDDGASWYQLAELETDRNPQAMFHYPTLSQDGCRLLVAYSVMYKAVVGFAAPTDSKSPRGGIRIAEVDLNGAVFTEDRLITLEMVAQAQAG
eukprot:CAMPEP_0182886728 /NCGR_PEP_ID=MMETSP0034_2-20130328/20396_1 /TAXON_ID=156128 /ORGANISM="Nephroselmis pyriformis, Strain CCMP717" /LENGTH=636 /DNA_ID=CAMNT_0025020067 /DNA_START=110 /DNA_END=2016 /DNA_ORIENTATION=-